MSIEQTGDGLPQPRRRIAMAALALANVMGTLDSNIANTALPTIARDLHVSAAQSIWIVNIFQLAVVSSLFICAALGQIYGPTRVYRTGVAGFLAASVVCTLASSLAILLVGRFLQGLSAAAIFSTAPALYREVMPRDRLGKALGFNAMIIATSTAAGPALGGIVLALAPWPWIYAINIPFGIANIALNRALPDGVRQPGRLDLLSAGSSAAGFALLIFGLNSFSRHGASLFPIVWLGLGTLLFVWFLRRQGHLEQPMFAVDLFRIPSFSQAAVTSFAGFAAQALAYVSLPYLFQWSLNATPFESALLMTSWPAMLAISSLISGSISDRIYPALLATTGLAVLTMGLTLYATMPATPPTWLILFNGLICGSGFGLFKSPNDRELMSSAPREKTSSASGVVAAVRTGGQSVGAAVVAIVFAAAGAPSARSGIAISRAGTAALWLGAGFALLATLLSASRLRLRTSVTSGSR
jgi:MFS transporter, DHA2 family, multidrug resistance protein